MTKKYQAFGLILETDFHFPELFEVEDPGSAVADVVIRDGGDACVGKNFAHPKIDTANGATSMSVPEVGSFSVFDGRCIVFGRAPDVSDDILRLYLLGSCMGIILQQRGYVVLHGNAVSTDGKGCTIFVGDRGAGKSTLAAYHYLKGSLILADDVCAIRLDGMSGPVVIPSYPQLKLWQDSADLLGVPTSSLRRVHPALAKFAVPLRERFAQVPMPVQKIVEISAGASPVMQLRGTDKFRCLLQNSYRYQLIQGAENIGCYQKKLALLAHQVNVERRGRVQLSLPPSS